MMILRLLASAAIGLTIGALLSYVYSLVRRWSRWRRDARDHALAHAFFVGRVADDIAAFNRRLESAASRAEARALVREQLPPIAADFKRAATVTRSHNLRLSIHLELMHRKFLKQIAASHEIATPPLFGAGALLRRVISAARYHQFIEPVIADHVREWEAAEVAGRSKEATLIKWAWAPLRLGFQLVLMGKDAILRILAKLIGF